MGWHKERIRQALNLYNKFRKYHNLFDTFEVEDMSSDEIENAWPDTTSGEFSHLSQVEIETLNSICLTNLDHDILTINNPKIAVFDIDDTVFNSQFIWACLSNKELGCKTFTDVYKKVGDLNSPIPSTINMIKQLHFQDVKIFFLTARPESDRPVTIENLERFIKDIPYTLEMVGYAEGIDDRKRASILKWKDKYNILFYMDDDSKNRTKVRDLGIVTLDVVGG